MSVYIKSFNETKYMSFLIKDHESIEKYRKIWDKVTNSSKNGLDSEPLYNKKYQRMKIKSYEGKVCKNFHDGGIHKEGSYCIFLSVILIDFVFKISKYYYPQMLLECKYIFKGKKVIRYITDDLKPSSDDFDENILMKAIKKG